ncbi:MAG: acyl-CoA carboxylase subunit epsilon [Actinobacteria bacterium]|nr:acyl-CoA carboxylase subunit epsilon [Actinomycetota bacterium]MBO0834142.1 acyl-CoA carboxylase subunit epsilon [Actinomycetota bacterium]
MTEPDLVAGQSRQTAQPVAIPPLLSVTGGEPTAEELAALLIVLGSRAHEPSGTRPGRSQWSAPARMLRPPLRPGPGAWRASGLPG